MNTVVKLSNEEIDKILSDYVKARFKGAYENEEIATDVSLRSVGDPVFVSEAVVTIKGMEL